MFSVSHLDIKIFKQKKILQKYEGFQFGNVNFLIIFSQLMQRLDLRQLPL